MGKVFARILPSPSCAVSLMVLSNSDLISSSAVAMVSATDPHPVPLPGARVARFPLWTQQFDPKSPPWPAPTVLGGSLQGAFQAPAGRKF
jgi:hypothetical protein